jgi:hypothetical protein
MAKKENSAQAHAVRTAQDLAKLVRAIHSGEYTKPNWQDELERVQRALSFAITQFRIAERSKRAARGEDVSPQRVQFNTGRPYAADGQIIAAVLQGNVVTFCDHSRLISGRFELLPITRLSMPEHLARIVMAHYDAGTYTNTSLSDAPRVDDSLGIIAITV